MGLMTRYADLYSRGPQLPGEGAEGGILIRITKELFQRVVDQVRADVKTSDEFKEIAGVKEVAHEYGSYSHFQDHRFKVSRGDEASLSVCAKRESARFTLLNVFLSLFLRSHFFSTCAVSTTRKTST